MERFPVFLLIKCNNRNLRWLLYKEKGLSTSISKSGGAVALFAEKLAVILLKHGWIYSK